MDLFKDEEQDKLDFKPEFDRETFSKKQNSENFSFPSLKCGEVFVSNSASGQFELKCLLCSRQYQKIKEFAKHVLKDHLNSDLEHSIDDLVNDNIFINASSSLVTLHNQETTNAEEQLTCEVNISSFLDNNEFEDENEIDEEYGEDEHVEEAEHENYINENGSENSELIDRSSDSDESKQQSSSNESIVSEDSLLNELRPAKKSIPEQKVKVKRSSKKLQCKYCGARYMMKCNLTRHINRKHSVLVKRSSDSDSKTSDKINCEICGKETTKYKLLQHLRSHDDSRYTHKCETCGKLFISERSLDLHNRNLHLKERPYACTSDKCDRAFVTEHALMAHQKIHTNYRPFMCPICHKGFFRKTKLDYHFETHHVNRQIFTCDECGKQFMNTKTLERHKICSHYDDSSNGSIIAIPNTTDSQTLVDSLSLEVGNFLKTTNNNENAMVSNDLHSNHQSTPGNTNFQQTLSNKRGNYECTFCPLKFIYKANLTEHTNRKHSSLIDHTKVMAEKAETDKRNATKTHSTLICDICGKETPKSRMRQHLRSHDNSRYTYKCETCGKLFISEKSMNIHIRNLHLKVRPFACKFENCNKKFATEHAVTAHYQIHTCERQFKCTICDKGFFTQAKLDYHVKTYHINGRIFKCDECDKRFYENGSLQAHKICHSKEKPFGCDECPARFPRERSLHIHKQSHSGIKEYFCKICNKDFALYNGIYTHMKTHGISYSAAMEKGMAGQRDNT